jgi:L-aspartate oxidase
MAVYDILIVGSGIAGLSLAIKLNKAFPDRKIAIITKAEEFRSATWHAQGGMSVVCGEGDSFESHIRDTMNAGAGYCNEDVVRRVVRHAPQALHELIENGTDFDRDSSGALLTAKEGGHSHARVVHFKDMTGLQIAVSLLVKVKTAPGISLLTHHIAVDLIMSGVLERARDQQSTCYGAVVYDKNTKRFENYVSRVTILATGGVGQVYHSTTNPTVATGDGIGMAYRAGATIRNMEFVQFHPTAFLLNDDRAPYFLITEALRGYGAFLRNSRGDRFMFSYDSKGELACRDVVSRAIMHQMECSGHPCVYLDCRHLDQQDMIKRFPNVYRHCADRGIDMCKDLIPVAPAAHYLCGGIQVDAAARTSIRNLYALGECAYTGLHGANRLASNSLLEAAVYAGFCFQAIRSTIATIPLSADALKRQIAYSPIDTSPGIAVLRDKVRSYMSRYAGVIRSTSGLTHAFGYLAILAEKFEEVYDGCFSPELDELRNMIACARLIVKHSLDRKENAGVFYNIDLDMDVAMGQAS